MYRCEVAESGAPSARALFLPSFSFVDRSYGAVAVMARGPFSGKY